MSNLMTIEQFNRLLGQETLHPLVTVADLTTDRFMHNIQKPCNFYALLCSGESLQMINPGEIFKIPTDCNKKSRKYIGVLFHPDLLCDTPLESDIAKFPCRCNCHKTLCDKERATINDCISCIARELEHSIDRYSSTIIVSQIGLLLNYCTRFYN